MYTAIIYNTYTIRIRVIILGKFLAFQIILAMFARPFLSQTCLLSQTVHPQNGNKNNIEIFLQPVYIYDIKQGFYFPTKYCIFNQIKQSKNMNC